MGDNYSMDDSKPRHCKMVGMYRRPNQLDGEGGGVMVAAARPLSPRRIETPSVSTAMNLPPSQRYNFYRYYGINRLPSKKLCTMQ